MSRPTSEFLDEWFPGVERRRDIVGRTSAFDCTRAKKLIGWQPGFR